MPTYFPIRTFKTELQRLRTAIAITSAIYVQLALGATMRHQHRDLAILDFPTANGAWIPNTAPAVRDSEGRALRHWPFGHYRVQPGTVWVASWYNVKSFDSRYFGPVPISEIKYHLRTLWVSPAWR